MQADAPIVLSTGFADDASMAPGMINGVLPKPWTADEVARALHIAMS